MAWYDNIVNTTKGNAHALANVLMHPVDTATNVAKNSLPYKYRNELAQALRGNTKPLDEALTAWGKTITPEDAVNVGVGFGGVLAPVKYQGGFLKGMPRLVDVGGGKLEPFGTDRRIVDVANQYMADRGMPYTPQTEYANVDVNLAKRLANAYDKMKDNPASPEVKKSYDALVNETMAQYEAARKAGVKFEFMPEGQDIYGNPRNAINDIVTNQHMYVFPTESGFGSLTEAQAANPLLQKTGEKWNGKDVTANDLFRAVHDYFGHAKHGVGFRATGEENAYQSHAKMFSPEALKALTSETRGQNSWLNYGPYGEQNRLADTANTIFADQKSGILPEWAWTERMLK